MNVLILGSGGREHALAEAFNRFGHTVFCHPGNPGMLSTCRPLTQPQVPLSDFSTLAILAKEKAIDLTVVGPELPLALGIADYFAKENLPLFGPNKQAAEIESSKTWSKEFMLRHKIPTAKFFVCKDAESAKEAAHVFFASGKKAVVKPSGLTGGKGVVCCNTLDEAERAIEESAKYEGDLIVEERLEGPEVSLLVLSDGKKMAPLLPARDHKRLLNGGLGPNTGGIGAIAPAEGVDLQRIERLVIEPTLSGLLKEGIDYRGVLYFGLMLTKEGPKVLEYNCRFGDPETQALLPLLESDPAELMLSCVDGALFTQKIRFSPLSSCCVVLSSSGYPQEPQTGFEIEGLEMLSERKNLRVFHAGTSLDAHGKLVTSGGRVLSITGIGSTLQEAIEEAYAGVEQVRFSGAHYRTDIGKEMD